MFGGERTRLELKRKFKREEKTFKELEGKSGFGFEAYESDEARLKEEAVNSEVKSKKTKRAGPRRRYKNKGFYDSSSEEESVADKKQENLAGQSASKVSSAKRTRENPLKVPVLMPMKQGTEGDTAEDENFKRKTGDLLHLLDPFGLPVTEPAVKQERGTGC